MPHAFTSIVGSGILALPWTLAQLGWIVGPFVIVFFAAITYYFASLLCDCYRTPDQIKGKRNRTYMDAVRVFLGVICEPYYTLMCIMLMETLVSSLS